MPKIKSNAINMYYEIAGSGQPVICISGFTVDHLAWRPVLDNFAQRYQTITFDNRGAGQTDTPDISYTIEMMADDVLALIHTLKLSKPHIVGHSMGGMIAQMLAYKYPTQIRSIAVCTARIKKNNAIELLFQQGLALREMGVSLQFLVEHILPWCYSREFLEQSEVIPMLIELALSNPFPQSITGYKRQLEAIAAFNSSAWLQQITVPTLVLAAEKDILTPVEDSLTIAQAIPNARYVCLKGAGHVCQVEQPEAFSAAVLNFLQAVDKSEA